MARQQPSKDRTQRVPSEGITEIAIQGFKSLGRESRIEVRPLTILAGANSSGKSSIMQPLLMMKQTLGVSTDPGPLLLNGPNVKFTSVDQFGPRAGEHLYTKILSVELTIDGDTRYKTVFRFGKKRRIEIQDTTIVDETDHRTLRLTPDQNEDILKRSILAFNPKRKDELSQLFDLFRFSVYRDRCFLDVAVEPIGEKGLFFIRNPIYSAPVSRQLSRLIHVPGLRGNRERFFATIASGPSFPGLFEEYVATTITDWQTHNDTRLRKLEEMLTALDMTREVRATPVNDTQIELQIGRLPEGEPRGADLVNIADVGFGVSQVLPVLIAFLVAERDQLVYVEQPELHLHPRAQYALARIMADTAKRGVRLVVETHSALLLLQVRTLMANGHLDPRLVKLHWFSRNPGDGKTSIQSTDLDEDGASGDWPEDFGDVELMAEGAYLDAVEGRSRR